MLLDQLKEILVTSFQADPDLVAPEATLTELELDSLDLVELSLVIEKQFEARVSDDELAELQRLDAIVSLIGDRTARAA